MEVPPIKSEVKVEGVETTAVVEEAPKPSESVPSLLLEKPAQLEPQPELAVKAEVEEAVEVKSELAEVTPEEVGKEGGVLEETVKEGGLLDEIRTKEEGVKAETIEPVETMEEGVEKVAEAVVKKEEKEEEEEVVVNTSLILDAEMEDQAAVVQPQQKVRKNLPGLYHSCPTF